MRADNLRINQLSSKTCEWYIAYLQAMDTKNVESYSTFLADDCVMQLNNNAPVQNKAVVVQVLSDYWTTFVDTPRSKESGILGSSSELA